MLFHALWRENEDGLAIALHHGSLAVEQRRKVEAAMVNGACAPLSALRTLDLGIDRGDVDLVIQMGAPKGARAPPAHRPRQPPPRRGEPRASRPVQPFRGLGVRGRAREAVMRMCSTAMPTRRCPRRSRRSGRHGLQRRSRPRSPVCGSDDRRTLTPRSAARPSTVSSISSRRGQAFRTYDRFRPPRTDEGGTRRASPTPASRNATA
ncbi:MAG: helicase-related protein [Alphaproteobacteria bacterium]